jgi:hypothetical protein
MSHEPANGVLRTTPSHTLTGTPNVPTRTRACAYVYCIRSFPEPNPTGLRWSIRTCMGGGRRRRRQEAKKERGKASTMISRYTPVIFPFSL